MKNLDDILNTCHDAGIIVGVVLLGSVGIHQLYKKNNAKKEKLGKEFPKQISDPKCIDLDNDGTYERAINIEGQNYLIKYDAEKNRASLVPYTIKPNKIEILEGK